MVHAYEGAGAEFSINCPPFSSSPTDSVIWSSAVSLSLLFLLFTLFLSFSTVLICFLAPTSQLTWMLPRAFLLRRVPIIPDLTVDYPLFQNARTFCPVINVMSLLLSRLSRACDGSKSCIIPIYPKMEVDNHQNLDTVIIPAPAFQFNTTYWSSKAFEMFLAFCLLVKKELHCVCDRFV